MSLYNDNSTKFSNQNTNSVGSEYAATYGHDISLLVQKLTNRAIFDAKPQQFMDLKLLNMVAPEQMNSDEFFFQEMGYQREPVISSAASAAVAYPNTQVISVVSTDNIATNTIERYDELVFLDGRSINSYLTGKGDIIYIIGSIKRNDFLTWNTTSD